MLFVRRHDDQSIGRQSVILKEMTKVQIAFHLSEPLNERQMARISDLHSVYGILRVQVEPSGDRIIVEYDATRLNPKEVEALLAGAGIPLAEE